jgi:tetratricopeptide (TPR) repeat protein
MLGLLTGRGDDLDRRNALTLIGTAALADGRTNEAIAAYEQALAISSTVGSGWHTATSELNLGTAKRQSGQLTEAAVVLEHALAIYEALSDRHFTARVLVQLGYIALLEGRPMDAGQQLERAMGIFAELGDGWAIAEGLEAIATLRSERDPRSAALLGGAAERLRERIAARPHPSDARMNAVYLERARTRLTVAAFDEVWSRGRQMALRDAIRLALETGTGTASELQQDPQTFFDGRHRFGRETPS